MKDRERLNDSTTFDPQIRMTDEGRYIHVSIGLPGVAEEQIRIDLERTTFTVTIADNGNTCRKVIDIPKGARVFKKKFSDGVLEIILEKTVP